MLICRLLQSYFARRLQMVCIFGLNVSHFNTHTFYTSHASHARIKERIGESSFFVSHALPEDQAKGGMNRQPFLSNIIDWMDPLGNYGASAVWIQWHAFHLVRVAIAPGSRSAWPPCLCAFPKKLKSLYCSPSTLCFYAFFHLFSCEWEGRRRSPLKSSLVCIFLPTET